MTSPSLLCAALRNRGPAAFDCQLPGAQLLSRLCSFQQGNEPPAYHRVAMALVQEIEGVGIHSFGQIHGIAVDAGVDFVKIAARRSLVNPQCHGDLPNAEGRVRRLANHWFSSWNKRRLAPPNAFVRPALSNA